MIIFKKNIYQEGKINDLCIERSQTKVFNNSSKINLIDTDINIVSTMKFKLKLETPFSSLLHSLGVTSVLSIGYSRCRC